MQVQDMPAPAMRGQEWPTTQIFAVAYRNRSGVHKSPSRFVPHDPASLPSVLAWVPLRLSIPAAKHPMLCSRGQREKGRLSAALFLALTQVGQNWNQLIEELNGWLVLGRDLEAQQV